MRSHSRGKSVLAATLTHEENATQSLQNLQGQVKCSRGLVELRYFSANVLRWLHFWATHKDSVDLDLPLRPVSKSLLLAHHPTASEHARYLY